MRSGVWGFGAGGKLVGWSRCGDSWSSLLMFPDAFSSVGIGNSLSTLSSRRVRCFGLSAMATHTRWGTLVRRPELCAPKTKNITRGKAK